MIDGVKRLIDGLHRAFLKCPTLTGGGDLTNAIDLTTITIDDCPLITSLDNITYPDGVEYIGVMNSNLKSIKNAQWPMQLKRLFLRYNQLTSLETAYPEFLQTLQVAGNPITKLENISFPSTLTSIALSGVTSVRGIEWPRGISLMFMSPSTITNFEIRESDFVQMQDMLATLDAAIIQPTCSDPTATQKTLGDKTFCVITDARFDAVYRPSNDVPTIEPTTAPPSVTVAPIATTVPPHNTSTPPTSQTPPTPLPPSKRPVLSANSGTGSKDTWSLEKDHQRQTTNDDEITISESGAGGLRPPKKPTTKDGQQSEDTQDSEIETEGSAASESDPTNPKSATTRSSQSKKSNKEPSGSSSDSSGPNNNGSTTGRSASKSSTTIGAVFAAVGALVLLGLFVVGRRRFTQRKKGPNEATDSPFFCELPATPTSEGSGSTDENAPRVGFLANDVRNDEQLNSFQLDTRDVTLGKTIARGGFGAIYRGVYRGRDVAIKQMLPGTWRNEAALTRFMDEIRLCAALNHDKIVQFIGITWTSLRDLSVVTEYMPGGDLHDVLRKQEASTPDDWYHEWTLTKLKSKTAIAFDVAEAVVYLHSQPSPIMHRDLKARNVLLDGSGNAKLSDFGISRQIVLDETMTSEIGTAAWIAPEVLRGERYSEKADIYSFGVLLVEMDLGRHPYAETDVGASVDDSPSPTAAASNNAFKHANIILLVSTGKLRPTTSSACPEDIQKLAQQCLSFDARDRPTAEEVSIRLHGILAP